jgi:hypothetical protein
MLENRKRPRFGRGLLDGWAIILIANRLLDIRILFAVTTFANMRHVRTLALLVRFDGVDDPKSPTPAGTAAPLCVAAIDDTRDKQENETGYRNGCIPNNLRVHSADTIQLLLAMSIPRLRLGN